jgi:hypothetical protein
MQCWLKTCMIGLLRSNPGHARLTDASKHCAMTGKGAMSCCPFDGHRDKVFSLSRRLAWSDRSLVEFKIEAVRLTKERGVSVAQAARDLDVHENVLRKWVKEFGADVSRRRHASVSRYCTTPRGPCSGPAGALSPALWDDGSGSMICSRCMPRRAASGKKAVGEG